MLLNEKLDPEFSIYHTKNKTKMSHQLSGTSLETKNYPISIEGLRPIPDY